MTDKTRSMTQVSNLPEELVRSLAIGLTPNPCRSVDETAARIHAALSTIPAQDAPEELVERVAAAIYRAHLRTYAPTQDFRYFDRTDAELHARAALAAIPAQDALVGWKPIEKHHGRCTEELLWVPASELHEGGYHCLGSISDYGSWHDDEGSQVKPSHFQPLPAPPVVVEDHE